jgi:hypothetical protein
MVFSVLYSAPAFKRTKVFTQKDGSTFEATPKGDEYLNYIETKNGDILLYNPKTKNYEFATIKDDSLVPSGKVYKKDDTKLNKAIAQKPFLSNDSLKELRKKRIKKFRNYK